MEIQMPSMNEIETQFMDFLRANSIVPAGSLRLVINGTIQRFGLEGDKSGEKSGAYCIFTDNGWPIGWAEDWHVGTTVEWVYKIDGLPKEQKDYLNSQEFKDKVENSKKKWEEERAQKWLKAADTANSQFSAMPPAPEDFPYLKNKNVPCYGLRWRPDLKKIAIPLRNIKGDIQSIQWIHADGSKRFFEGSTYTGAFFSIALDLLKYEQYKNCPILVGEGYATMATVYELTGYPCVAAMNCGNLINVAKALKEKYPKQTIIFMADNDHLTEGNPGITHALNANSALKLNGIISPKFKHREKGSDWNDYFSIHGAEQTAAILRHEIFVHSQNQETQNLLQKVTFINAEDLLDMEFEPLKWAVDGFLPSGLSILAGGPKVGKSILALHLAVGVAIGGCVLGKIFVQQGDVLYMALEDNDRRLKERIIHSNMFAGDERPSLERLTLVTKSPRQHEGGLNYIRWWLINHPEARLVIIDTLQMFRKQLSGKGSMYSEDYDVVSEIKKLADEFDVPFLIIHHLKKAKEGEDWLNKISGSQGIAGAADSIFVLERARVDNGGILHRTGRDVEEMNFAMTLDGFGWVLQGEAEKFTMPEWKRQIIDYLKEHGSVTPATLATALNLNINTAQQNLRRLVKDGELTKEGYGTYKLSD